MKDNQLISFFKGYSIFTIVIYHFVLNLDIHGILSKAIMFGGTGVHLFIFISGYGLYCSYIRKPLDFNSFIIKRLTKIYIPYIIVVLLSFILANILPIYPISLYALSGHVFLYKMFDSSIIESYGGQFWFISTIIQFYFSFHLILYIKKKVKVQYFIIFGIIISLSWGVLILFLEKSELRSWNSFYLQYVWEFILGIFVADKFKQFEGFNFNRIYYLIAAVIFISIFGLLAIKGGQSGKILNDIPGFLGYTSLATYLYKLNFKSVKQFFLYTSKISFSLYLWHVVVILTVKYLLITYFQVGLSIWYVFIIIPISYLISFIYDKLIARLINNVFIKFNL